jgi:hypothetical protein
MKNASVIFEEAFDWLIENYKKFYFHKERDIIWTLQKRITKVIEDGNLPFKVYDEYPLIPGTRCSIRSDLAILKKKMRPIQGKIIEAAVEFKYDPDHNREDMLTFFYDRYGKRKTKFPVVFWKEGVGKDVEDARMYFSDRLARISYAIFIDEGGYFRHKAPFVGARWREFPSGSNEANKLSVHWFKLPSR